MELSIDVKSPLALNVTIRKCYKKIMQVVTLDSCLCLLHCLLLLFQHKIYEEGGAINMHQNSASSVCLVGRNTSNENPNKPYAIGE